MASKIITLCSQPDCPLLRYGHNPNCFLHYKKDKRHNAQIASNDVLSKRFWRDVQKGVEDDCWLWVGCREKKGYGSFELQYKHYKSHQVSFFLHNGYWASPMVLHSCDNPPCCNPKHLREGDVVANAHDAHERNRFAKGSKSSNAKLIESQVIIIKRRIRNGDPLSAIAKDYGVNYMTIFDIRRERCWSHIN
jgi:hypothetical protein